MVVVSEFVGCSPSVSGAIRVNPWSLDAVADGIYKAIKMPRAERHLRHDKHWRYISQHTVRYWTEVCSGPYTLWGIGMWLAYHQFNTINLIPSIKLHQFKLHHLRHHA